MLKLTARQEQILNLIKDAIQNTGFPPTRAEIATELGFRSTNAAEEHLQALARKGVIEIAAGTSRGIRLLESELSSHITGKQLALPHPALMQLSLPLVGRVAAGSPILASEHIESTYHVDPALFGIFDGDLLAVKKADSARNGQIVVARLGDDVTVKRYKKTGNLIELMPENPDYPVIKIGDTEEDFALEGLAVGLMRNWV
ncbi:MAG: repressor LexA [Burkholderiales bacterium]|nr:repressor LexA [Burkholderiales bacterium]